MADKIPSDPKGRTDYDYQRCRICGTYNKLDRTAHGGIYEPTPHITGAKNLVISGKCDPWLSGMPKGSTASTGSTYVKNSPVLVPFTPTAGHNIVFTTDDSSTEGTSSVNLHGIGAENGIEDVAAPIHSLMGVFLTDAVPSLTASPGIVLDFTLLADRNYTSLSPLLKQPFFIGTGRLTTSSTTYRSVVVPTGATRLYLSVMDSSDWNENTQSYNVTVVHGTANAYNFVDSIDMGGARIENRSHVFGCMFCGSPNWR